MAMRIGLAAGVAVGCARAAFAAQAEPEGTERVSVVLVKPEGFTDTGYSKSHRSSQAILLQLQRFLGETATSQLPEPLRLEIKVADVDLAGGFELFHGPRWEHVRIIKKAFLRRASRWSPASSTPTTRSSKKANGS